MHKKSLLAGVSAAAMLFTFGTAAQAETLSVFGPWLTVDQENFQQVLDGFTAATGIETNYSGSDSFEQQIVIDTQAGSAPNIAVFPQPGLAADLASKGLLTPLGSDVENFLVNNYSAGQSWVDLSSYAGADGTKQLYAFPFKADVKSLVWYSPDNFAEAGYEVPQTMEDLLALSAQIVADGGTPWCIGLGSGAATGWPATDWVEDIMLRTQPPEVYDGWVNNSIPFNDPRIVAAIEQFGQFALTPGWADGGPAGVASTDFRDSPKGLFSVPPKCYMHHQASFIPSFFPEGTQMGVDADFFYMPAFESKDLGRPVLGAGTLFAITKDSPEAHAFIDYLETTEANEIWMGLSGFLTPRLGVDTSKYANDALRGQGEILLNATTFRFDGSDLMPGAVGAGSFWTGMVDYVGGKSAQDVADEIQSSWDAIK
jgi:alpha-glucoside transport system substrate-binding protein